MPDSALPLTLKLGTAAEFAAVRAFLHGADFTDATLCRLLKIKGLNELWQASCATVPWADTSPALEWAIKVLARGQAFDSAQTRALCGETVFAAFRALGLLRDSKADAANVVCPVWLYPLRGQLLVSDRRDDPDGGPFSPAADVVFPAIYGGTLRFLDLLPAPAGGDALDLCGGTGVGALLLAKSATTATTADLTPRATFFAEFNGRLNGIAMESLPGDLYAPVAGRQFDFISAHPPFVPATGPNMVYRDGGETGEEITRRTIEGLPDHLRAGGLCVILCVSRDTDEKPFEWRVRDWLGEQADAFEIVYGCEKILSVEEVVESMKHRGQQISAAESTQLIERLKSRGTRQFVYGATFIQRHDRAVAARPTRVRMAFDATAADFQRVFNWQAITRRPDFETWLAASRPRLAPGIELTVRHVVSEGQLVPAEFMFSRESGFPVRLKPDGFVVPLAARLNGQATVAEVFATAREADELPPGFRLQDFAGLVRMMLASGLLLTGT